MTGLVLYFSVYTIGLKISYFSKKSQIFIAFDRVFPINVSKNCKIGRHLTRITFEGYFYIALDGQSIHAFISFPF